MCHVGILMLPALPTSHRSACARVEGLKVGLKEWCMGNRAKVRVYGRLLGGVKVGLEVRLASALRAICGDLCI